jgi:hypothetical protein
MSFICKVCGFTTNGEKQTKVPIKIRDVEYNLQAKTLYADGESVKTIRKVKGTEIVEEVSYCNNHKPEKVELIKVGKVTRNQLIKTVVVKKFNKDEEEEE